MEISAMQANNIVIDSTLYFEIQYSEFHLTLPKRKTEWISQSIILQERVGKQN